MFWRLISHVPPMIAALVAAYFSMSLLVQGESRTDAVWVATAAGFVVSKAVAFAAKKLFMDDE